jgi:abortive infection bacteriophage resistance protein
MRRSYTKPPTTYAEQVALLQSRGMKVADLAEAESSLQHLNYYRLVAYWLPFEADHATHAFQSGTTFNDVLNLYAFDRSLRLVLMDCIERIEISARSHWAYHLGHLHGSHAHLDQTIADDIGRWDKNYDDLAAEVSRSEEIFIQHFETNYVEDLPPVWAVCEVMSLGLLSRWYRNLHPMPTRRAIADVYDIDPIVLQSWLHHLSLVRNFCAHHARIWNRDFKITPVIPRSRASHVRGEFRVGSRRIYNTLLILLHLMDKISPGHSTRRQLRELIALHKIEVRHMGFPSDWETRAVWQDGGMV